MATKPIHFATLLLVLPCFVLAQNSTRLDQQKSSIDSLVKLVNTYATEDSTRVDILNETGFQYWTVETSKSESYGKEALRLAERLQYVHGIAMANRVIGVAHWAQGNFPQALRYLFYSQELYKSLRDTLGEANSTMNIGLVYAEQKNQQLTLKYYTDALSLFKILKKTDRIGITYTKIGIAYVAEKNFDLAYEYFIKALQLHNSIRYSFGIQETYNQLGLLYREKGDFVEAKKYLQQSLVLAEQRGDVEYTSKNLENLASIYIRLQQYAAAEKNLARAYSLANEYGNKKSVLNILNDLKEIATVKKDYKSALHYFEEYESIKDSIFSQAKNQQIAALEKEREEKEKEQTLLLRKQEILLLQQNARIDNLIKITLGVGLFALATIGFFVFKNQRLKIRKNHELLLNSRQLYQSKQHLAEVEIENTKLKEKELRQELELKNRELTSYAVNFIQKNELLEELQERIENIKKTADPSLSKELNSLIHQVQQKHTIDRDWEDFKLTFENVHANFFSLLLQQFPDLSPAELKLCALIRLNLSMKETAALLGISADSAKTARYRLRKKLALAQEQSLSDFILQIA
jgi:tetratricopeptide (TPR) repeat protein